MFTQWNNQIISFYDKSHKRSTLFTLHLLGRKHSIIVLSQHYCSVLCYGVERGKKHGNQTARIYR